MPKPTKPDVVRSNAENDMTEPKDEIPSQALTSSNTITPTVSNSDIRTVGSLHVVNTSPSRAQRPSRSHRSSSSSQTVKLTSNAAGKAREHSSSSSSSDNNEYGEAIAPRLDPFALRQLPTRLQQSMLSLQRERELRAAQIAAQQVERPPLSTPQRTTPLGSHPPTDDERTYARGLRQHYREAAAPKFRLRTRPQPKQIIAPFMEYEEHGLPETETVLPPGGRRMLRLSSPMPNMAGKLSSAKKWVQGMFREKGEGRGGGQGEGEVEMDGEEEEEEKDVGPVAGQQMTSRGRLEGYF
ncbi:hypothetical protein MMC29_002469 [Sticta canariensis]|nr:hypothetical protein [Sticta canariensis]